MSTMMAPGLKGHAQRLRLGARLPVRLCHCALSRAPAAAFEAKALQAVQALAIL